MPDLFSPLTVRGVTLRNRIGVSPMCQYSYDDGFGNDWLYVHLASRAVGGAGLIIVEATAVEDRGRISPRDLGIWTDAHAGPLQRVARVIAEHGAAPGIQLAHAGRKASTNVPWEGGGPVPDERGGWETIGPSAVPFKEGWRVPREMTLRDIEHVRRAFVQGAERAIAAGFTWIELHAAHGYLLHSFLSPLSNHRSDEYGGSFDNRVRLLMEVARDVRAIMADGLVLAVRISATDWVEGGWTIEDSVELSRRLKEVGVDLIDCSSGGNVPRAVIPVGPGYQVPFAEQIRARADVATAAVGMINHAEQADEIIRAGRADVTLLARAMLRDPYWPLHAARQLGRVEAAPVPQQYARAF